MNCMQWQAWMRLLYLNMPASSTVQTIGSKKLNIRAQGQENRRITVILAILTSGEKQLLIFKTKKGKIQKENFCK